ncbi:CHAP domain-containing protein [Flavobacterium quisquiliarum]|uniref:CHAP domain-containing protein n=1 Tax=Flavobacterium quisquiliarum TaxID=1834436 RepID=A0ABV8W5Y2_9FLAO|nr:CHAP domain-containing protein [Flavobacterium quisquiliarum]MBW1656877.1 CHAP domain-containing protein [Flavobacterium quisquiliarum]NWK99535.1 CHAP domain-containing protein [Flavobacterium collinsii]
MKIRKITLLIVSILVLGYAGLKVVKKINLNSDYKIGQALDSLNGVKVYYNGGVDHIAGRNVTKDNYNLGLKYQCVEFVKRYYYEHYKHKMPDAYGHAKDFFDPRVKDGELNSKRDLTQYTNPSKEKPEVGDLMIFSGSILNRFGHVAIISKVSENEIEIIQQNPGPFNDSREKFELEKEKGYYKIKNERLLGWLRKEK